MENNNDMLEIRAFRSTIADISMEIANLKIENNFLKIKMEELSKEMGSKNNENIDSQGE